MDTVTEALVPVTFGALALALMVDDPAPPPVTGTGTLVALGGKFTLAGTVATPVLLELRFTTRPPAGAGADRFKVRFWVELPGIVSVVGAKLSVAPTCTP